MGYVKVFLSKYSLLFLNRDPRFIRQFKAKYAQEAWGEHVVTKKKRKLWRLKGEKLAYPYEEK